MTILNILQWIAAAATILTGLLVLVKPKAAEGFTGLRADGPRGISEFRAIFGGLFISAPFAIAKCFSDARMGVSRHRGCEAFFNLF
jgi:hypothetical protein